MIAANETLQSLQSVMWLWEKANAVERRFRRLCRRQNCQGSPGEFVCSWRQEFKSWQDSVATYKFLTLSMVFDGLHRIPAFILPGSVTFLVPYAVGSPFIAQPTNDTDLISLDADTDYDSRPLRHYGVPRFTVSSLLARRLHNLSIVDAVFVYEVKSVD